MARMRFICDPERCIDCNGCSIACKEGHHVPVGVNRRRLLTVNEGEPGEVSVSVSCMHCSDAPCVAVCPVNTLYIREDGVVNLNKDTCIGCGYCFMACPFGAPQFPRDEAFGTRGIMDKCTFCSGGPAPDFSDKEKEQYGQNRLAEGKTVLCAGMCATKALMGGDNKEISRIFSERALRRDPGIKNVKAPFSKAYESER